MNSKKLFLSLLAMVCCSLAWAAPADSSKITKKEVVSHLKQHFKPYGFIRNYFTYDSRECIAGTGDLYFYMPKDEDWTQYFCHFASMAVKS